MPETDKEIIWAPWRMAYILGEKDEGCFICRKLGEDRDEENFILERGKHCLVILNLFPYNNGHLMVAPKAHKAQLEDLTPEESAEIMEKLQKWVRVMKKCFAPEGFNLGANLGRVAGAGLDTHLHFHLVPRWNGDTNFMPVLGGPKVMPDSLQHCFRALKQASENDR